MEIWQETKKNKSTSVETLASVYFLFSGLMLCLDPYLCFLIAHSASDNRTHCFCVLWNTCIYNPIFQVLLLPLLLPGCFLLSSISDPILRTTSGLGSHLSVWKIPQPFLFSTRLSLESYQAFQQTLFYLLSFEQLFSLMAWRDLFISQIFIEHKALGKYNRGKR